MQPAKRLHDVRSRLRRGRREALEVASTWPDRAHSASQRFLAIVSDIVVHRFPLFSMVVAAILLVAVCVVVWTITLAFVSPGDAEERTNLLATLAQIVGGFALLAGLYMTFRTYRVNREGQITERFSRAIDHLGKEELAIRLGGIGASFGGEGVLTLLHKAHVSGPILCRSSDDAKEIMAQPLGQPGARALA